MTVLRPALRAGLFACAGLLAAIPDECPAQEPAADTAAAVEAAPVEAAVAGETPAAADGDYREVFARMRNASLTWEDPGRILLEFLATADERVLERMRADDDNDIAFTAAWETIRRGAQDGGPDPRFVDAAALNRFVGFVEGRLRVPPPPEWSEVVLSAYVTEGALNWLEHVEEKVDVETPGGWRVSGVDEASDVEGKLRIGVAGRELTLPISRQFDTPFSSRPLVSVAHDGRLCYVAHFSRDPIFYSLYCLDLDSGDREWAKDVQVSLRQYALQGPPGTHRVWIVPRKKTVVVFGIGNEAYIEVFRKSDGRNLCRFCTDRFPQRTPQAEE